MPNLSPAQGRNDSISAASILADSVGPSGLDVSAQGATCNRKKSLPQLSTSKYCVKILRIDHAGVGGREYRALVRPVVEIARDLQLVIGGERQTSE